MEDAPEEDSMEAATREPRVMADGPLGAMEDGPPAGARAAVMEAEQADARNTAVPAEADTAGPAAAAGPAMDAPRAPATNECNLNVN